jgi:SAM-dependent methyltransferase
MTKEADMGNAEQIEYWNGDAGKRWAEEDDTMARLLRPVCEALLDHAPISGCTAALDVGCGGGSQSFMLAERLGSSARVLGVDISEPMLGVARRKHAAPGSACAQIEFLQADASNHRFPPDSFDLVFSRFGVMFFDDPVAAFSNLRGAMQAGGKLAFCCWQSVKNNDWVLIPLQAALQFVPAPEPMSPDAPGPFAFADAGRVESILGDAGFGEIAVQPLNLQLRMSEASELGQAVRDLARIGPVSRLLTGQSPEVLEKVFPAMETALEPCYQDGALTLPASIWLVTAVAS